MSLVLSFGNWGGVYVYVGYTWRICLGWMTLTMIPNDIDVILNALLPRIVEGE